MCRLLLCCLVSFTGCGVEPDDAPDADPGADGGQPADRDTLPEPDASPDQSVAPDSFMPPDLDTVGVRGR
ncbi:MAG: hypothetical protein R3F60_24935 [bacterium]